MDMTWLGSANAVNLVILIIGIIFILITIGILASKMGSIKVGKGGIELSKDKEKTLKQEASIKIHEIQRKQLSYVKEYLSNVEHDISKYVNSLGYVYYEFNIPYVIELMYDEIISWIVFNNMDNSDEYIKIHKEKLWLVYKNAIVLADRTYGPQSITLGDTKVDRASMNWESTYFEEYTYKIAKDIINTLVMIKDTNE